MVFSSTLFIFLFLPITLIIYFILPKVNIKNAWLIFVSLAFFAWSQPRYVWVILASILINYIGAVLINVSRNKSQASKILLTLTVILNLLLLFYFKYFNFTIDTVKFIIKSDIVIDEIILPIGISFFTFQGLSYTIDVYRGTVEVQKNPFKVALYIMLFPQLIAGPIVRYQTIANEIDNRTSSLNDFAYGIERFIIGLSKKAILANALAVIVDNIWKSDLGGLTIGVAWLGSIAYTLQIYFDFSGYSDMAIGLGRLFGFHFDENFNLPYISKSISDFWRRWHISLSTWFREYVYIPLGGNRKRVYLNLAIVFLLTGIWHGANWTFILWGIWHGIFILIERALGANKKSENRGKVKAVISIIYTVFVVNIGWVLFRAPDLMAAKSYILNMFGVVDTAIQPVYQLSWYMTKWNIFILMCSILIALSIPQKILNLLNSKVNDNLSHIVKLICLLAIFGLSIFRIVGGTYNPFIYFQF